MKILGNILLVAAGGAVGCVLRYGVSLVINAFGRHSVLSTLICNIIGCFCIGLLIGYFANSSNNNLKLLLVTGLCGGFTTFSTFSADTISLFQSGQSLLAVIYVLTSVVVGVLATLLGLKLIL